MRLSMMRERVLYALLLLLFVNLSCLVKAQGLMEFGPPVHVKVPFFTKNVAVGDFDGSGYDGFATISWEIDGRHERGRWELGIYLPNHEALKGAPKGSISFSRPTRIFGFQTTGPYEADIAVANVDNKLSDDILVLEARTLKIFVFLNDGKGNFEKEHSLTIDLKSALTTEAKKRPLQIITGNFNTDPRLDIAVLCAKDGDVEWGIFSQEGSPTIQYQLFYSYKDIHVLKYRHDSPYYTTGEANVAQSRGNVYQMVAFPFEGSFNKSLWSRTNRERVWGLDLIHIAGRMPSVGPMRYFEMNGPFTVADLDGNKRPDLILGGGRSIIYDVDTPTEHQDFYSSSKMPPYGGILAEDFNLDGFTDLARISGGDVDAEKPNPYLHIVFGDGTRSNPIFSGGLKKIGLNIIPSWWENKVVMVTGNFTNDFDIRTRKPFRSLLVLGTDLVTIFPNVGYGAAQLQTPVLMDFITGSLYSPGDAVQVGGQFYVMMDSEITQAEITPDVAMPTTKAVIDRKDFKLSYLSPGYELLEFKMPVLPPGVYKLKVKNAARESNEVLFTIR